MSEHTEIPCIERLRNARRLAWRAGFEEAMRTVEINLALLLILAQQQVDEAEPGSPRQQRARQRLNDLRKAFTVITANPVDRIDSKTRLATALRAALEQALDAAHVPESSNRPERARAPGRLVTSVPPHGVVGKHPMPRAGRAA